MYKIGDNINGFTTLNDQGVDVVFLEEVKKSKYTLLYFYPKDDTPGCTMQACGLNDNLEKLRADGVQVFGIGKGTLDEHKKFKKKYNLAFDLLLDLDLSISKSFGVVDEKSMFGKKYEGINRTSFLLDESGTVLAVVEKVNPLTHVKDVRKVLKGLKQ